MELNEKEWLDILPAIEGKNRFKILQYLREHGKTAFSQVQRDIGLSSGNCSHHLNILFKANLIDNSYDNSDGERGEYSYYHLLPLGEFVMDTLLPK